MTKLPQCIREMLEDADRATLEATVEFSGITTRGDVIQAGRRIIKDRD